MGFKLKTDGQWRRAFAFRPIQIGQEKVCLEFYEWRIVLDGPMRNEAPCPHPPPRGWPVVR